MQGGCDDYKVMVKIQDRPQHHFYVWIEYVTHSDLVLDRFALLDCTQRLVP
jgi:hypothetical protein